MEPDASPRGKFAKCAMIACALIVPSSCKEKDYFERIETEPIEATLKTAVPLGYAASLSAAVVNGEAPPDVEVLDACAGFPCTVRMRIACGPSSLPHRMGGTGEVLVVGRWTSATQGVLSVSFLDAEAGSESYPVSTVVTFPVTVSGGRIKVVYADIDLDIAEGPIDTIDLTEPEIESELDRSLLDPPTDEVIALGMDAWVVEVETNGTPGDPGDDEYAVSGGGQYVGASSSSAAVYQLALVDVTMASGCELNPIDGIAVIQETAASSGLGAELPFLASATLSFHPGCDGEADVLVATGNYLTSTGQHIDLRF